MGKFIPSQQVLIKPDAFPDESASVKLRGLAGEVLRVHDDGFVSDHNRMYTVVVNGQKALVYEHEMQRITKGN